MKERENLNYISVATMYVGVIVGAGFASGRETWQFFGIFGKDGFFGSLLAGLAFALLAFMIGFLAVELDTDDMGKIISVVNNKKISEIIGYMMVIDPTAEVAATAEPETAPKKAQTMTSTMASPPLMCPTKV